MKLPSPVTIPIIVDLLSLVSFEAVLVTAGNPDAVAVGVGFTETIRRLT